MQLEQEIQTTKFSSETQKATINILFTSYWLRTKINVYLKAFGLTHEQFNVMRILKGKDPEKMCVKDIGIRMIEKNSNVPRILDRLEKKGLIERQQSKEDRRETESSLTPKGLALVVKTSEQLDISKQSLMNLDEETATKLNVILENIRNC